MNDLQTAQLEKIVKMVLFEVPNSQIAVACNISEEDLQRLTETKRFKEKLELLATEHFEEQQLINKGWDTVEQLALGHVVEAMQVRPDPEFALKVAAVANKSTRRNHINHDPIQGNVGARAVVNLSATFVDKLQQNFVIENQRDARKQTENREKRQVNMLGVAAVENLLKRDKESDVLDGMSLMSPA